VTPKDEAGTPLDQTASATPTEEQLPPDDTRKPVAWNEVLHDIAAGGLVRTVLAIVLSLAIAGLLVIFTNEGVSDTLGYLFSRPGDFFAAAGRALGDAGTALVPASGPSPTRCALPDR
jgi:hypothetical protein